MSKFSNGSRICSGLVACILLAGTLISGGAVVKPALAQACDKVGGRIVGAVIGHKSGSLFGKGKGRKAAKIGGAVLGGALGAKRDRRAKARCLQEREAGRDRDMQRQLAYDRQRLLQQEQVRKEIEEQRLYEEWRRGRQ